MRVIKRIKTTKEGFVKLKQEYEQLLIDRPAAVKELSRAREMGDLSENGLYTAAKARLRNIDGQIRRLDTRIKLAEIYEKPKGVVGIGSKVLVEQNGERVEYEIVGDFEANPILKKISSNSPIGHALVGKKESDITHIETPKGKQSLTIIKIH